MKKIMIGLLIMGVYYGCEPGYGIYIRNSTTSTIYLKTHPSIESLYDKKSVYYDSIVALRTIQEDGFSTYGINPNKDFRMWGNIGAKLSWKEMPFDYILIIRNADTLKLDNKERIFNELQHSPKSQNYYLVVK